MKILVADKLPAEAVKLLEAQPGFEVHVKTGLTPEQLADAIEPYHAIVIRSASKVTAAVAERGRNLKVVVRAGVGLDNVDRKACEAKGIKLSNTPAATSISVAELALGLMLSLARHIHAADATMKAGKWEKKIFEGTELYGKTLGLVGAGRIGRELAIRCQAMGMKTLVVEPVAAMLDEARAMGLKFEAVDLPTLLSRSDYVSLHVPLTDSTRDMIGAAQFKMMKKTAYLVNCARGGVIHEESLIAALREKTIAGAALDVYPKEPLDEKSPLRALDNLLLCPHLGASAEEGQLRAGTEAAAIVIETLTGKKPVLQKEAQPMTARKPPVLWIPGPTEVPEDILKEFARPQLGHRSSEFGELMAPIHEKLKQVMFTKNPVIVFTSSATGVMEACIRNGVRPGRKVLCCVNGAFSKRWSEMPRQNGVESETLKVEMGKAIKPEMVDAALAKGGFDAVTVVHNETSTGVMSPVKEIAAMVRAKYPEVLVFVDTVSSLMGYPIRVDEWGLDVCLASVQKVFTLPPGIAVAAISERTFERAKGIEARGSYFDFVDARKYWEKNQTPATPAIPHLYGLAYQLDRILKEGLENRFARHERMAGLCQAWANKHFKMFPEPGFSSWTVSTIANTTNFDVSDLVKKLVKEHGIRIADGYGDLKGKTFRIGHMGEHTVPELLALLKLIDGYLGLKSDEIYAKYQ